MSTKDNEIRENNDSSVIIHKHWLALMQGACKFLGWFNSKWIYSMVEYDC